MFTSIYSPELFYGTLLDQLLSSEALEVWCAVRQLEEIHKGEKGTFLLNGDWCIHFSYGQLARITCLPEKEVGCAIRELIALGFIRKLPSWEVKLHGGDTPDTSGNGPKKRAPYYEIIDCQINGRNAFRMARVLKLVLPKLSEADAISLAALLNAPRQFVKKVREIY